MIRIVLVSVCLLVASLASAQTNDCDTVAPTSFTMFSGAPVTVTICWDKLDATRQPTSPKEWALFVDGVRTPIVMTELPLAPTAGGLYKFSGTRAIAKGTHALQMEVVIDDGIGGTISAQMAVPFALRSRGAAPHPPVNARVQ